MTGARKVPTFKSKVKFNFHEPSRTLTAMLIVRKEEKYYRRPLVTGEKSEVKQFKKDAVEYFTILVNHKVHS